MVHLCVDSHCGEQDILQFIRTLHPTKVYSQTQEAERSLVDVPTETSSPEQITDRACSRGEAMEMAMRNAVIAHLVICILVLAYLTVIGRGGGILIGFGIAAVLASTIPFLVLPIAAAIGFLVHLGCQRTRLPVPLLIRTLVILFEVTLLAWIIVLITLWGRF